ncbi:DUF5988 family protein [Streptomyces sp. TRM70308]|uniref:DUF5988 family protein n=1 Tax=Streptomyces TaxID=1883 RepID=UPI0022490DE8|nr:DUF5988 family protein [Streptomyces sp. JHD 1]MCX2971479.1 DUF5988 family protein [Streptomyces sp. JHD 1]
MPNSMEISTGTTVNPVRLEGGPVDLSGTVNLAELAEVVYSDEKIKIRHGNGYEHYEAAGPAPTAFRWVGRTKIAE